MENQHRAIKGYRELTEREIADMNAVKKLAADIGVMFESLSTRGTGHLTPAQLSESQRWRAIAKTDLQKGFMALIRSIALPDSFA